MGGLAQQMSGHVLCKSDRSFNSCNSYFGYEIRGYGYGAIFKEGDCWICMELMDISLDKFYKFIYNVEIDVIPETVICLITSAVVQALHYLKDELKIIHRDVKVSEFINVK